ncbi:MAG: hypothetical protein Q3M24_02860 [Candidatus Electrothrix aestuarii]|uniref:Uncharacterized protein n=1 Tax=Candidatus Electrothrix aestuarii TaxID=3062594 RepID=A0AAU8LXW1_9BACT|nr:hypothetical protein [Candidatus Electrothrix aestuarii]
MSDKAIITGSSSYVERLGAHSHITIPRADGENDGVVHFGGFEVEIIGSKNAFIQADLWVMRGFKRNPDRAITGSQIQFRIEVFKDDGNIWSVGEGFLTTRIPNDKILRSFHCNHRIRLPERKVKIRVAAFQDYNIETYIEKFNVSAIIA